MSIFDITKELIPKILVDDGCSEIKAVKKVVPKFRRNYFVAVVEYNGIDTEVIIDKHNAATLVLDFNFKLETIKRLW